MNRLLTRWAICVLIPCLTLDPAWSLARGSESPGQTFQSLFFSQALNPAQIFSRKLLDQQPVGGQLYLEEVASDPQPRLTNGRFSEKPGGSPEDALRTIQSKNILRLAAEAGTLTLALYAPHIQGISLHTMRRDFQKLASKGILTKDIQNVPHRYKLSLPGSKTPKEIKPSYKGIPRFNVSQGTLKRYRVAADFNQNELAQPLNKSKTYISKLESADRSAHPTEIRRIHQTILNLLQAHRQAMHLSSQEVAQALGIPHEALESIESGAFFPTPAFLSRLRSTMDRLGGQRLNLYRKQAPVDLAVLAKAADVSWQFVRNIENNDSHPSTEVFTTLYDKLLKVMSGKFKATRTAVELTWEEIAAESNISEAVIEDFEKAKLLPEPAVMGTLFRTLRDLTGPKIRARRMDAGIKQREAGPWVGHGQTFISEVERNVHPQDPSVLRSIYRYLLTPPKPKPHKRIAPQPVRVSSAIQRIRMSVSRRFHDMFEHAILGQVKIIERIGDHNAKAEYPDGSIHTLHLPTFFQKAVVLRQKNQLLSAA